ncbi:MAG: response regulator transcription factor [Firmicutes bacterium]|nr:response regulator transcription factor [Bacillota bacterium]
MKVLIADDEKKLVELLKEILKRENIDSDVVYNGAEAVDYAIAGQYDLIVLDIMMPKMTGFEAIKELRRKKISTPILFLSAKSEVGDKVDGLNLGGDDYLTKPFAAVEFIARVKALTRRQAEYKGNEITVADLTLDRDAFVLRSVGGDIKLGSTEYRIMEILMSNPKTVVNKERLVEKVWGWDNEAEYNNAEVYISFLRKKLAAIKSCVQIKAVRGIGYRLSSAEAENDDN